LNSATNNYLISIYQKHLKGLNIWGLSFCDISTGEFKTAEYSTKDTNPPRELLIEIFRLRPSEIILPRVLADTFKDLFPGIYFQVFEQIDYYENELYDYLLKELQIPSFKGLGLENFSAGISASSKLLEYILGNRKSQLPHINTLVEYFDLICNFLAFTSCAVVDINNNIKLNYLFF
jgi:DNA mismatch repair ATPase MutS